MVLFIAAALAIPVVLCGVIFKNRTVLLLAAIIMAGVGVATGNPYFIMTDLFAVGLAYLIGLMFCEQQHESKNSSMTAVEKISPTTFSRQEIDQNGLLTIQAYVDNDENIELSKSEIQLIIKHVSFYESLELGAREPTTDEQKHFVAVIKGKAEPRTSHEIAFKKYIKLRNSGRDCRLF